MSGFIGKDNPVFVVHLFGNFPIDSGGNRLALYDYAARLPLFF